MKLKVMAVLAICAVIIGLANFSALAIINQRANKTVEVFVATEVIKANTLITPELFEVLQIKDDEYSTSYVSNIDSLVGYYTKSEVTIWATEIISINDLEESSSNPYEMTLKEGTTLLTIKIEDGSLRNVIKNSYVDLYFKGVSQSTNVKKAVHGLLVRKLLIVDTLDQEGNSIIANDKGKVDKIVVLVTKDDLNLIQIANELGQVYPLIYCDYLLPYYNVELLRSYIESSALDFKNVIKVIEVNIDE